MDTAKNVLLISGRDRQMADAFSNLLRAAGLRPLTREEMVRATGYTSPHAGEMIAAGTRLAQATVILFSPDEIVEPRPDLASFGPQAASIGGQPRANVIFEAGMALAANPERTIIVETGHIKPISDLAGLNVVRFDGSATAIRALLTRLRQVGCKVDVEAALKDTQLKPSSH